MKNRPEQLIHIIHNDTVDSTNEEARRLIDNDNVREWTVIVAECQTNGRGTGSNRWVSDRGDNLLFSVILKPWFLPPEHQFSLNMSLSLGIIHALKESTGVNALIKWPNDIYYGSGKLGGLLIQHYISAGKMQNSVAGCGINVNQVTFPADLPNPVSLRMITGNSIEREPLLHEVLQRQSVEYSLLGHREPDVLKRLYLRHLYLYGQMADYVIKGKEMRASITDVDEFGRLILLTEQNSLECCDLKEIVYL